MIKCETCGKEIVPGNDENGLPNGVGFELEDGSLLNVCSDCIAEVGRNPKYLDEFLERRKREKE